MRFNDEYLQEKAERFLSYWEIHGDNPEVVAKWAVVDMLEILRSITGDEEEHDLICFCDAYAPHKRPGKCPIHGGAS